MTENIDPEEFALWLENAKPEDFFDRDRWVKNITPEAWDRWLENATPEELAEDAAKRRQFAEAVDHIKAASDILVELCEPPHAIEALLDLMARAIATIHRGIETEDPE